MAKNIEDLLAQRTDLSQYFVHLTRDSDLLSARQSLVQILMDEEIEARNNFGLANNLARTYPVEIQDAGLSQKACCFSEIPLEHAQMMVEEIRGRSRKFRPFGLIVEKECGMTKGLNPVWYLNTRDRTDHLTTPFNRMVSSCFEHLDSGGSITTEYDGHRNVVNPTRFDVLRLTPFIEQTGPTLTARKDFSWEREWRLVGDFVFRPKEIAGIFAPALEHESIRLEIEAISPEWRRRNIPIVAPSWDVERIQHELQLSKL
ncbi:abortive infection system antitoxin AbiGi family protein [Actinomycetes bacterium M1A6_2h]